MKKKQPFPHRVQTMVSAEVFKVLENTRRQVDTSHAEAVRHYIELGIKAEKNAEELDAQT